MGKVILSPDIKKESVRLDGNGNEIDPRTKQIIKPVEKEYVPSSEDLARAMNKQSVQEVKQPEVVNLTTNTLSEIKEAIKRVQDELDRLNELKRVKVEQMKKELEEA